MPDYRKRLTVDALITATGPDNADAIMAALGSRLAAALPDMAMKQRAPFALQAA